METSDGRHVGKSPDYASLDNNAITTEAGTGSRAVDGNSERSSDVINTAHQRRRVNPESLALRLGPDLVRDLDALITPGNTEMPSFAVRKELQERYSIDRRHIYDYFHSRGLRVVKEDKHGNPVPAKSELPTLLPNLRPQRQAPIKNTVHSHSGLKLLKPRGITKVKPGRPKKNPFAAKVLSVTCETNEFREGSSASVSEQAAPAAIPKHTYVTVNPLLHHHVLSPVAEQDENYTLSSTMDQSFSVRRAIGDVAYAYRHKFLSERMQQLTDYPVRLAPAGDRPFSWNKTSPCPSSAMESLLPHVKPLTRDERYAIYETLSDSIGPAQGIQECQGTYRKHMEARTKVYFEGLLSIPSNYAEQPSGTSMLLDRKAPSGTSEFRHWLSETRFLRHDGINGSPRLYSRHRNGHGIKQEDVDGVADKPFGLRSSWLQTLDELFPTLGENTCNNHALTDSPIVRMREVTRTTALADGCNTGDRPLISVTVLPTLSFPSVAEIRQTGQLQSHGVSDFSGSEEVKTQMPAAEMDSHSWRENDPYITYPEQRPATSDILRRSRNASNDVRIRLPSYSPCKHRIRDLDRTRTRPVTSRDTRRRTTSAAGDI